jgi:hypothetical protein
MNWIELNAVPLINIIGILMDICGAFLVATEVVDKFQGSQFGSSFSFDSSIQLRPRQTKEFKVWTATKEWRMKLGLLLLTIGFTLQLIANVFQLKAVA